MAPRTADATGRRNIRMVTRNRVRRACRARRRVRITSHRSRDFARMVREGVHRGPRRTPATAKAAFPERQRGSNSGRAATSTRSSRRATRTRRRFRRHAIPTRAARRAVLARTMVRATAAVRARKQRDSAADKRDRAVSFIVRRGALKSPAPK